MKFNVVVDMDWVSDNGLNETFERKLLDALTNRLIKQLEGEFAEKVVQNASAMIRAKTELLIQNTLEKPCVVSTGWQQEKKYPSIFAMVEEEMTELYTGKLDNSGKCKDDPLLASIKSYVKSETEKALNIVDKKIATMAAKESKKAVNNHELIKAIGLVVGSQ